MKPADPVSKERQEAWIGDAVLGLFARRWILQNAGRMDSEMLTAMTSNQFLSTISNPTRLESRIGRRYREEGLAEAFALIEAELLPKFLAQQRNRARGQARLGGHCYAGGHSPNAGKCGLADCSQAAGTDGAPRDT
jgi:hypothetical protein